ncbi:MAG: hypothetical protein ACO3RK_00740 [Luteolibacter sp.]
MTYIFRILAYAILAIALNACGPPEPVPAPYFIPNPPYPPQTVDIAPGAFHNSPVQENQSAPANSSYRAGEYPWARLNGKPNQVISPYEPYHTIDVSGFSTGQLARDPSNKKIFRVP